MFLATIDKVQKRHSGLISLVPIAEMKLVIAAIYTNFETEIVDAEGIEQTDAFISGPVGEKLVLRFKKV